MEATRNAALPAAPASPRFVLGLLAAFLALWAGLAMAPWFRQDWLLENVLEGWPLIREKSDNLR